ncbi:winged helix-turn-helix transcriptional regulator [Anaeromyxobacter oryzae]|uniref:HxlR family transcriptional regulator n=1 Tax=Anaeromyxobacter oryzae TaxID=2918170 RepID=A0ABM7X1P1_9BACT|nr:helix-turn-helix domain-containing protein [Anaeromyxobacter oryzae]BDG05711.1 HxlR family transcriptional regulator [Anaeromyxobacter oryzae]
MTSYGQFCSIARTLDVLGERWSILIVRELLSGSRRFSEIQRGIPRISRTMLSARLRELADLHVLVRHDEDGPTYSLTESGRELGNVVRELGVWGQRWLPRTLPPEQLDADLLLWDMHRRVRPSALPSSPFLVRLEIPDAGRTGAVRYLLLRASEVSLCAENPGFPERLVIRSGLRTLVAWWRGDLSLAKARREGMRIEVRHGRIRDLERWFERYLFADVPPANAAAG